MTSLPRYDEFDPDADPADDPVTVRCPACGGRGSAHNKRCELCDGSGHVSQEDCAAFILAKQIKSGDGGW